MDLEELRTVREQERRTDSLQHLRDTFYDDATKYVRELKRERSRRAEDAGDPYAPEAMRLTDEIDTAAEVIESLYERRRGKVVKLASFAAAGMPAEKDGMTDQERTMFDDLVERIEANEEQVLGKLDDIDVEGEATSVPSADPPAVTGADATSDAASPADTTEATGEEPTHVIGDPTATDSEQGTPTADAATTEDTAPAETAQPAETAPTAGSPDSAESVGATADTGESPPSGADDLGTAPESPGDGGVLADAMGGDTMGGDAEAAGDESVGSATATSDAAATGDTPATGGTTGGSTSAGAADATDAAGHATTATTNEKETTETTTPTTPEESTDSPDRPAGEAAVAAGTPDAPAESSPSDGASPSSESSNTTPSSSTTTAETPSTERTTVRVTTDVGEIFGVDDRSYHLQADDVVHLPAANAEPLVQQDAAEPLE